MPVHGHTDKDSNIYNFNKDKAISHPGLNLLMRENKYMSYDCLNEQQELLVLNARRALIKEINESEFVSIICDEASDASKIEQMSFSVRHSDDICETKEDFIGIAECQSTSAHDLQKNIEDIVTRCAIVKSKIAGEICCIERKLISKLMY